MFKASEQYDIEKKHKDVIEMQSDEVCMSQEKFHYV